MRAEADSRGPAGGDAARDGRLSGRELALLQLLARGYALGQVARLRGAAREDVLRDLQRAAQVLGAATVPDAVREAKRRGLDRKSVV